jgi:glycine/D-amino acid oxidase-like deaminating enzyme
MDLHSPTPYSLLRHGIINSYPSLDKDIKTEIVVMGAGISGALVAWHLCKAGYKVVVVDRRHVGTGSTAASTSLLQYEIDKPLRELISLVGEKNAIDSYLLCRNAISDLSDLCNELRQSSLLSKKPSLQYASFKKHLPSLEKEFSLRKQAGIHVQWLDEEAIHNKFGFKKPGAILSSDGAEADAYMITHSIFGQGIFKGMEVYDNTEIVAIHHQKNGVELVTADNMKIKAGKLIIACGYESQQYIPQKVQSLHSTYAIASEPYVRKDFWYKNALIWETAVPYLYLRTTSDNRVIIGGKDDKFSKPVKRDEALPRKITELEKSFRKLFPSIPFKTDFSWAGTFASTKDGLPYIGCIRQRPNTYFALGFGGNGITFSIIAAQIIKDMITGNKNDYAEIFSFDR